MKNKKLIISLACAVLLCSFFGCARAVRDIKDANGADDHSLSVLGESELCAEFNESYSAITPMLSVSGDKSYADLDDHHDGNIVSAQSLTPVSGVVITQSTYGKTDSITFTVTSSVTEGNVRVYLYCYDTASIWHDFLINGTETFTAVGCLCKEFDIRVACESAMYKVEMERTFAD